MNETNYFSILWNSLTELYDRRHLLTIDRIYYEIKVFKGNITRTDCFAVLLMIVFWALSRTLSQRLLMVSLIISIVLVISQQNSFNLSQNF